MRKSRVENKYHLSPSDITKAVVLNKERMHKAPFWRNDVINAWCLSETTIKCKEDSEFEFGTYNSYWIGFYDDNAKSYAIKIKLSCSDCGGMCGYEFSHFFDEKEIKNELDLEIQEKLLKTINWLLDEKIICIDQCIGK